jgi:hypothetical protein
MHSLSILRRLGEKERERERQRKREREKEMRERDLVYFLLVTCQGLVLGVNIDKTRSLRYVSQLPLK